MFSYRHAFHAGNHADVLKHLTLVATLRHLMRKDSPLTLVDTHAGAGIYRLDADAAQISGEAGGGIVRLQSVLGGAISGQKAAPALEHVRSSATDSIADALQDYLGVIASFNRSAPPGAAWRVYPGSPFIMQALMSEPARAAVHDRLRLFEMHPTDAQALDIHVAQLEAGREVSASRQDGFEALKALLPPPASGGGSRRALVLIDPSYEIKTDYAKVAAAVQDGLKRFATGVYMVWYPIIPRPEAHGLPRRLKTLAQQAGKPWLHATLSVGTPREGAAPGADAGGAEYQRRGLTARGIFVINPPHTLAASLQAALPQLQSALSAGPNAAWTVDSDA